MTERIDVKCEKCGHIMHVPLKPEFRGKKISFQCKNPDCSNMLMVSVPVKGQSNDVSTTVTFNNQGKIISGELEIVPTSTTPGSRFLLSEGNYLIGRRADGMEQEIPIETVDKSISRMHCMLKVFRDRRGSLAFSIKDHKSKNGVVLNHHKLGPEEEIFLMDGDILQLGSVRLVFHAKFEQQN